MQKQARISTRFRQLLKQELKAWEADGTISAEQSGVLSQKYRLGEIQKESTHLLVFAIYIIGVVLVGAGVISFVAAHWEDIPAAARVAMIVGFMLACHVIGYNLWQISDKSPRLGHALVVLGTLVFGANIGLMAQIFHIRSNFYNGFFAWALGAIIMAYALRSVPNAVVAILVWFTGFCGGVNSHEQIFVFYPLVAAVVFLPVAYLCRSAIAFSLSLLAVGLSVVIYVWANAGGIASYGITAPGLALLFFGWGFLSLRTANYNAFGVPAMIMAGVFIAFGSYASSFHYSYPDFSEMRHEHLWLIPVILAYLSGIAVWLAAIKQVLSDARVRWIAAGLLVCIALVAGPALLMGLSMISPDLFWCVVCANAACLLLALVLVANSFTLLDRQLFWAGVLFTALVITTRFLEYETELLIKAVVFITCGIVLILAGVGFENYLKQRRPANE